MTKRKTKPANMFFSTMIVLGVSLLIGAGLMLIFPEGDFSAVTMGATSSVWSQLAVAFVTGLTTGGLSCLAVQGGLLASSLAYQIEKDLGNQPVRKVKVRGRLKKPAPLPPVNTALPIGLFLLAKLIAYSILGVLLGWLGSFFAFSPITRAILLMAIAAFMIGNGLRMLNVHPIFRYFNIEPPKFITRYIRRTANNSSTDTVTPVFLGVLTVFIPCGITQAMMAVALGSGSAVMGGGLMFAFTLGTSPIFFLAAYLTTRIGMRLENLFMRFVAIVVLALGVVTLNNGLNLIGSPYSFENIMRSAAPQTEQIPIEDLQATVQVFVNNDGYYPATVAAKAGVPVTLQLVTDQTYSCARDFVIPALGYYRLLPETGTVQVEIPAQVAGTRMFYTCSMGMYTGEIIFR